MLKYLVDKDLLPITFNDEKQKRLFNKIIFFILKSTKNHKLLDRFVNKLATNYLGVSITDINLLCYALAKYYGEINNAKSIDDIEASLIGNPENVFYINNKPYTLSLLYCYCQYAYCCNFINFNSIHSICEIGGGFGKQIELFKKFFPDLTIYYFDIPPALYVAEQYLKSVFPDSVISYKETRNMKNIPKDKSGKIFIFGAWKISEIDLNYDLFFNSRSFQEIEPKEALNYLNYISKQTTKIFLNERMKGTNEHMIEKTTLDHYKQGLKDFKLVNLSHSLYLPNMDSVSDYSFSFWER